MIGQRLRAAVVLAFVFALGALAGIAYDRHHSGPLPATLSAAEVHEAAMAELREAVGLDDQQIAQIHAIMAERQEVVQQAWERLRPEVVAAMSEVHAEIAELLRPEQRQAYHEWLTHRHQETEGEGALIIRH